MYKKIVLSINVRVVSGENGLVWKKCFFKLIKIVFKFFMVFKDGNISKILKMFKFLKFYFVSFVVLLFESNYKEFGVGKILDKSVVYFVVFKKDVEFKKE